MHDDTSCGCLDVEVRGKGKLEGMITKVHEIIFEGNRYVHYRLW